MSASARVRAWTRSRGRRKDEHGALEGRKRARGRWWAKVRMERAKQRAENDALRREVDDLRNQLHRQKLVMETKQIEEKEERDAWKQRDGWGTHHGNMRPEDTVGRVVLSRGVGGYGKLGQAVKTLHALLTDAGCHPGQGDLFSGAFGSGTERAVKAFQAETGLEETGVVDKHVWAALLGRRGGVGALDEDERVDQSARLKHFWKEVGLREEDAVAMVRKAREEPLYANVGVLRRKIERLKTLLPQADVAQMVWREPRILAFDAAQAPMRLLALGRMLPNVNVVCLFEKQPSLLLDEGFETNIRRCLATLETFTPYGVDLYSILEDWPELLFRIQHYEGKDFESLPVDIKNAFLSHQFNP